MANTTNLNLSKLLGTEKLKTFPSPYNDNMDAIDGAFGAGFGVSSAPSVNAEINALADGLAIVANGNTHAAITSGQYVYVRNHSTLTTGLYKASSNIAENATLSGSNLTADSNGGLNTLSDHIVPLVNSTTVSTVTNLDDAPLGYSKADGGATNNPCTYSVVIITTATDNGYYKQQMAIPVSSLEKEKQYYRVKDGGTWSSWYSPYAKMFSGELSFDGQRFPCPSGYLPKYGFQLTLLGRNITNGAIYVIWYNGAEFGFEISTIILGNAPQTGEKICVQYFCD